MVTLPFNLKRTLLGRYGRECRNRTSLHAPKARVQPSHSIPDFKWWEQKGLNLCNPKIRDLQSPAFDRSAILPYGTD